MSEALVSELQAAGYTVVDVSFFLDARTKHLAHALTTDIRLTERVQGPDGAGQRVTRAPIIVHKRAIRVSPALSRPPRKRHSVTPPPHTD